MAISKKAARRKARKHAKKLVKRIRQADFAVSPNGRPMDTRPLGKPGSKRQLSDYERGIAHALMRRGIPKQRAIPMARGLLKKANRSGRWGDHGRAHAATRAGAAASIAQRKTFSNDREMLIDLATAVTRHFRYRHGWIKLDGNHVQREGFQTPDPDEVARIKMKIRRDPTNASSILWDEQDGYPANHPRAQAARYVAAHQNGGDATYWDEMAKPVRLPLTPKSRPKSTKIKAGSRTKTRLSRSEGRSRAASLQRAAMREQAKRQLATLRLRGAGRAPSGPRATAPKGWNGESKSRPTGVLSGGGYSQFSQVLLDQCLAEAERRDLDFAPRWKHGWIPLNAEAVAIKDHHESGSALRTAKITAPKHYSQMSEAEKTAHVSDLAQSIRDRAGQAEPTVTKDLIDTVTGLGGQMEALQKTSDHPDDFRFKTPNSLVRKLRDKSAQKGITPAEYAPKIADALRYTALFHRHQFVDNSHALLEQFKNRGYKVVSVENTFHHGQAYSGVNVNLQTPSGLAFELQLHTPESIRAKHRIHGDYEVVRDPAASLDDRKAAYNRMMAVNSLLVRPDHYEQFGQQVFRPDSGELHDNRLIRKSRKNLIKGGFVPKRAGSRLT